MSLVQIGTATKTLFGEGARRKLPQVLGQRNESRLLIVASDSALRRPLVAELVQELRAIASVETWDKVRPNPRTADIDACRVAYKRAGITHVVGLGGGSALDQAKATAMALSCDADMPALLSSKTPLPERQNTLILLPTTSGTGAELSYGAILTDKDSGAKLGLRGASLAADHALVDPELTWGTPVSISMVTGFDVLTHALETWLSTAATPYTRDLSRGAIERVFRWLPTLHDASEDPQARREMAYASMIMGINLALSTTCLPHRLQYPIGAATDTAHAAGLAAIYPAWLDHVLPHAEAKLAECADWIAPVWDMPNCVTTTDRAAAFVSAVKALLHRIALTPTLQQLGVTDDMAARFPSEVSGRLDTDPCYESSTDLQVIYQNAFDAGRLPL